MAFEVKIDVKAVGVALLVSNDYKTSTSPPLSFTHTDTENMEQVLKHFGYDVYRKKNLSDSEFLVCYRNLADHDYSNSPQCKRILIYFSGHGSNGVLLMQNGNFTKIEDIIACFKPGIARSETVARMTKMFFFDACRGYEADLGSTSKGNENEWMQTIPKEGGVLVAYASAPKYKVYEDCSGGWTYCLVQALKESKESDHVYDVLTSAGEKINQSLWGNLIFQNAEFTTNLIQSELVYFKKEAPKK